jgi:hypothetical protein
MKKYNNREFQKIAENKGNEFIEKKIDNIFILSFCQISDIPTEYRLVCYQNNKWFVFGIDLFKKIVSLIF